MRERNDEMVKKGEQLEKDRGFDVSANERQTTQKGDERGKNKELHHAMLSYAMLCYATLCCMHLFDSSRPQDNQSLHKRVHNILLDRDKTEEKPKRQREEGKERARNMNVCVLSMDGCNETTRVINRWMC